MASNSEGSRVSRINRRKALHSIGVMSIASLAGCSGSGGDDGGGDGGGGDDGGGDDGGDGGDGGGGDDGGGDDSELPEGEFEVSLRNWATDPGIKETTLELIDGANEMLEEELTPPETTITVVNDPKEEYETTLRSDFAAGNAPDIFQLQPYMFHSWVSAGRVADLNSYYDDDYIDQFYDIFVDPWVVDGERYGVPKDVQVYCMYYNERLLEEAGVSEVPETWDELYDAAVALKENTDARWPIVEDPADPYLWWGGKWSLDGRVMNDDFTECVIANDGNVQTMEFLRELREDDLFGFVETETNADWTGAALGEEEAAIMFAGAWPIPFFEDAYADSTDEDIQTASMPVSSDGEEATGVYTLAYSVPPGDETENPEAVNATALRGVESHQGMEAWTATGVALTPFKAHRDLPLYEEKPRLQTMVEDIEIAQGPVWMYGEHAEEIYNIQTQKLEAILTGDDEPREGLEAVEDRVNSEVLD